MPIALSQAQTEVLETLVKQGKYTSLEEALNIALLLLLDEVDLPDADHSPRYLAWAEATRRKVDAAREQVQHGEILDADLVIANLKAKVQTAKEIAV